MYKVYKPHRISHVLLAAVLLLSVCVPAAFSASRSSLPAGVQSFAPTGTVPENVSFRIVFRNPVIKPKEVAELDAATSFS